MKTLERFSIPIEGLKNGLHEKKFSIDSGFFDCFEQSPIKSGNFEVNMTLDKRSDFIQLNLDILGGFDTTCDRCTADIQYPIDDTYHLMIKYADSASEELNVMYITRDTHHVNISKFLYDSICLSMPISKVYDCRDKQPYPCDEAVLDKLDNQASSIEEKNEEKSSIWDSLDKLELGNN